jgi:hypothetical protein
MVEGGPAAAAVEIQPVQLRRHNRVRTARTILAGVMWKALLMVKENRISRDKDGRPDLGQFTDPLAHYIGYYEHFLASLKRDRRPANAEAREDWDKRIFANWGFIAKGAEALPYVLRMLKSPVSEAREDAAGVLDALGQQEGVIEPLIEAVQTEEDEVARGSMITALGALRNKKAIPVLAQFIRDQEMDEQNRWDAAESLGKIVRKRFVSQEDPILAANNWLKKHGY